MKIKSNVRAGSGGASGSGQNSKSGLSTDSTSTQTADTSGTINNTVVTYYAAPSTVSRCVGI
jgi:hypothetical protein